MNPKSVHPCSGASKVRKGVVNSGQVWDNGILKLKVKRTGMKQWNAKTKGKMKSVFSSTMKVKVTKS